MGYWNESISIKTTLEGRNFYETHHLDCRMDEQVPILRHHCRLKMGGRLAVCVPIADTHYKTLLQFLRLGIDMLYAFCFELTALSPQVFGPEATMTGICKQAIECIMSAA